MQTKHTSLSKSSSRIKFGALDHFSEAVEKFVQKKWERKSAMWDQRLEMEVKVCIRTLFQIRFILFYL